MLSRSFTFIEQAWEILAPSFEVTHKARKVFVSMKIFALLRQKFGSYNVHVPE